MNKKTPNPQTQAAMTEARAMARNRMPELAESTVDVESFPSFTKPARQRWGSIPADIRKRLLPSQELWMMAGSSRGRRSSLLTAE